MNIHLLIPLKVLIILLILYKRRRIEMRKLKKIYFGLIITVEDEELVKALLTVQKLENQNELELER